MSTRVDLLFETKRSQLRQNYAVPIIRLRGWVQFQTLDGFTRSYRVLIDTGSPISVIPFRIWAGCKVNLFGPDTIGGLLDKPECEIPAQAGEVSLILHDTNGHQTDLFTIRADLCDTSEVPLILGMHDVLARGKLYADYPNNEAWLEV